MLGLFDSGRGGLNTVGYLRQTGDADDLLYLIDRENAPYGIKTEKEITEITIKNIDTLAKMGASAVLIACCTASTVYQGLPEEYKRISLPIIKEVAKEAKNRTRLGRIAVISTRRTAKSHAFLNELRDCEVTECDAGKLVGLIDGGLSDGTVTEADKITISEIIAPAISVGADTLVLGCTHFPALKSTIGEIARAHGVENIVDSAKIGAEALRRVKNKSDK